jgi:hypothetical protein
MKNFSIEYFYTESFNSTTLRDHSSKPALANSFLDPISKKSIREKGLVE